MAYSVHDNWYQSSSIRGGRTHAGDRGIQNLYSEGVLESRNSIIRGPHSAGLQQCQKSAIHKSLHLMEEVLTHMLNILDKQSQNMSKLSRQFQTDLEKFRHKDLESKKKLDERWEALLTKMSKKNSKAVSEKVLEKEDEHENSTTLEDEDTAQECQENDKTAAVEELAKIFDQHNEAAQIEEEECCGIGDFAILLEKGIILAKFKESKKRKTGGTEAVLKGREYKLQHGVGTLAGNFIRRPNLGFLKKEREGKASKKKRERTKIRNISGGFSVVQLHLGGRGGGGSLATAWRCSRSSLRYQGRGQGVGCGSGGGPGLLGRPLWSRLVLQMLMAVIGMVMRIFLDIVSMVNFGG